MGTGSNVYVDETQTKLNDGTTNNIVATIAHELLSHSVDMDTGVRDERRDSTGVKNEEIKATQIENLYRENSDGILDVRRKYGDRIVPTLTD